jgi:MoaA/NifB/PqqE/SkfB family radical SAM enzyme
MFQKVELQLASWCNRSCGFCPSGKFPVPREMMTDAVVERVAGELGRLGFQGRIAFHLMSEPLLYKRFEDVLRVFRRAVPRGYFYVHTNGDVLSDYERIHRLFEAGLNDVLVNCYDSQAQFDSRNANILELVRRHPDIWYWNQWLCVPPARRHEWRVVRLRAFFGTGYTLRNWAGHVATSHDEALEFPLKLDCDRPREGLHVNYRGQVVLCNNDWKFEAVAGDLMKEDAWSVWTSPLLERYREHLARRDRNLPLCRTCDNGYPHLRDPGYPHADRLVPARRLWGRTRLLVSRVSARIQQAGA